MLVTREGILLKCIPNVCATFLLGYTDSYEQTPFCVFSKCDKAFPKLRREKIPHCDTAQVTLFNFGVPTSAGRTLRSNQLFFFFSRFFLVGEMALRLRSKEFTLRADAHPFLAPTIHQILRLSQRYLIGATHARRMCSTTPKPDHGSLVSLARL